MPDEGKRDYRNVHKTRKSLADSLLKLAKEKPLNKITVTEICSDADVSRNAYYAHYEGLYAQVEALEGFAVDEIKNGFDDILKNPDRQTITEVMTALTEIILKWRVISELLLCTSAQTHFTYRLKSVCAGQLDKLISILYPDFSNEAKHYYRELFFDALFSLYRTLLQEEKPDIALFVGFAVRVVMGAATS